MGTREGKARSKDRERSPGELRDVLLFNEARGRIMALLEQRPGMNKHQVAESLGLNPTTVEFHLRRLRRHGFVDTRQLPKKREVLCFTAENVTLWENPATRFLFGRGTARDLAVYLAENPVVNVDQIAEELGLSAFSIRRHMRLLKENELVSWLRVNRKVFYEARAELVAWVEEVQQRSLRIYDSSCPGTPDRPLD